MLSMRPETGAKMSEAAFTLSTAPIWSVIAEQAKGSQCHIAVCLVVVLVLEQERRVGDVAPCFATSLPFTGSSTKTTSPSAFWAYSVMPTVPIFCAPTACGGEGDSVGNPSIQLDRGERMDRY